MQFLRGWAPAPQEWLPSLVMVVCVLITIGGFSFAKLDEQHRIQHSFQELAQAKTQRIGLRIEGFERTLFDVRGLFIANQAITNDMFQRYLDGIALIRRFPGLLRLSYAPYVPESQRSLFEAARQRMDNKNFTIHTPSGHGPYIPILYNYPPRQDTIGEDLNTNPVLRGVLATARDSGQPQISPAFQLKYDQQHSSGFLMFLAVYQPGKPVTTVQERRQALAGYLYITARLTDIINNTLGPDFKRQTALAIYDSSQIAPDRRAYQAGNALPAASSLKDRKFYSAVEQLQASGRPWTFLYIARPQFFAANETEWPAFVLIGGLFASGLLTLLANLAMKRRQALIEQSERDQEYRSLFNQNTDAVFYSDLDGYFIRANEAAAVLLGVVQEDMPLYDIVRFVAPECRPQLTLHMQQIREGRPQHGEMDIISFRGERLSIAYNAIPIHKGKEISGIFVVARDITDRLRKEQELAYLARYDTLTSLPNRTLLLDRLIHALARSRREGAQAALLFLDLDKFKQVNDSMGHAAGDIVLKTIAGRLKSCLREEDTVARLGGDEFTVLIDSIAGINDAVTTAQKIIAAFHEPLHVEGKELYLTTSIGLAFYPKDAQTADEMMKAADLAMYHAKSLGRNTYQLFRPEMLAQAAEIITLKTELAGALARNEFVLYYQPQIDVKTGQVAGVEALLRWQHPTRGMVFPAEFVPLTEEMGLIEAIGEWTLRAACMQSQAWQAAGYPPCRMAVNVSARQFKDAMFCDRISRILKETGTPAAQLELEITESLLMDDLQRSQKVLGQLKKMGVSISIDDFGTGYSSLSYLANFPLDTLKIDRSFVSNVAQGGVDANVAETIISLGRTLKLAIVAEGVETREQVDFLKGHHSDLLQGYYFSAPLPADAFAQWAWGAA